MVSSFNLATATALLSALASAAPLMARDVSAPFNLTITNVGTPARLAVSNAPLSAPHVGAGEEALNYIPQSAYGVSFTFNQTGTSGNAPPGYSAPGYLQYLAPMSPEPVQRQLQFYQNASSNVLAGTFGFGSSSPVLVAFRDDDGAMGHYDSGVFQPAGNPPMPSADPTWYLCPITITGDHYETVSYVADGAVPDDSNCEQVIVKKIAA